MGDAVIREQWVARCWVLVGHERVVSDDELTALVLTLLRTEGIVTRFCLDGFELVEGWPAVRNRVVEARRVLTVLHVLRRKRLVWYEEHPHAYLAGESVRAWCAG